jgi:hypothetical protein
MRCTPILANLAAAAAGEGARAASGHAAAPPSSLMNSRRFIRSPYWFAQAA